MEKARHEDVLLIDGAISAGGATVAMLTDIARAGPFGAGHPEPVFALPSHTIAYAEEVGQAHVRARLRAGDGAMLNAIAFRAAGKPLGNALIDKPRAQRARRRHALDRPLERPGARAVPADGYGAPSRWGGSRVVPAMPASAGQFRSRC